MPEDQCTKVSLKTVDFRFNLTLINSICLDSWWSNILSRLDLLRFGVFERKSLLYLEKFLRISDVLNQVIEIHVSGSNHGNAVWLFKIPVLGL